MFFDESDLLRIAFKPLMLQLYILRSGGLRLYCALLVFIAAFAQVFATDRATDTTDVSSPAVYGQNPIGVHVNILDNLITLATPWIENTSTLVFSTEQKMYLEKSGHPGRGSILKVKETEQKTLATLEASWPLLISFRPKHKQILFVEDEQGNQRFQLKLWNFAEGVVENLNVPVMTNAARWTRWTPDGMSLLLIATVSNVDEVWRVDFSQNGGYAARRVYKGWGISCVSWAPDGRRCVLVSERDTGGFFILDTLNGEVSFHKVEGKGVLRDCTWSDSSEVIVFRCRNSGQSEFRLLRVELDSDTTSWIDEESGPVVSIAQLPDAEFLYAAGANGSTRLKILCRTGRWRDLPFIPPGSSFLSYDRAHDLIVTVLESEHRPKEFLAYDRAGGCHPLNVPSSLPPGGWVGVRPTTHMVPTRSGKSVRVLVWESPVFSRNCVLLSYPVRRTFDVSPFYDGTIQFLLSQGIDYVAFDFTPTHSNGAGWDLHIGEEDVDNAAIVGRFLTSRSRYFNRLLVAVSESNGTSYVARTFQKHPHLFDGIFMRGIVAGVGMKRDSYAPIGPTVTVLQGENDPLNPEFAKRLIKDAFGESIFSSGRGRFVLAKGEGHSLRKPGARALRAALLLEIISSLSNGTRSHLL